MHVFLTGEIQIGKSTVLQKTLKLLKLPYGGFRTYYGPDRHEADRCLYINDAACEKAFGAENVVVHFCEGKPPEVFTERFDTLGSQYIMKASQKARLLVFDECGSLERSALLFQKSVLDALDGPVPILGVVKLSAHGWADGIRSHPKVRLVTVDMQNRDNLPPELAGLFTR